MEQGENVEVFKKRLERRKQKEQQRSSEKPTENNFLQQ